MVIPCRRVHRRVPVPTRIVSKGGTVCEGVMDSYLLQPVDSIDYNSTLR